MPKKRPAPPAPHPHIQVSLTLNERDAIDSAKARLRRFVALACHMFECEHSALADYGDEAQHGVGELLFVMSEDVATIDDTFKAADARSAGAR